MSQAICGILRLDGGAAEPAQAEMLARRLVAPGLAPRIASEAAGPVAMAAVRLARRGSDDPGDAPVLFARDGVLLAADLTVHDRAGVPDAPSEAEALADLIDRCGPEALGDLHGDFALAFWRNGRLILARDHFGTRPLTFTYRSGDHLAFASSPAALLAAGLAGGALDDEIVTAWLLQPAPPPGRCIYREIVPVAAGHAAIWSQGDAAPRTRRYWRLDTGHRRPFASDDRALATEMRALLEQAVARRLPRSGPGAGHLSGGLDSSTLAVIAARQLAPQGRIFHGFVFREPKTGPGLPDQGDAPIADLVAAAEPRISPISVADCGLLAQYRQGIEPGTLLPLSPDAPEDQAVIRAAELGAGVIFTGWGGDQIASYPGRGAEVDLLRAGRLIRLWRHLQAEARATGIPMARLFRSTVIMQTLPQRLRERLRGLAAREVPFLATMAWRSRLIAPHRRAAALVETWPDEGDSHQIRRAAVEAWNPQARLEAFALTGLRHGIRFAHPLLDLDLVRFAMEVPGVFFRRDGQRRALFRQAIDGLLPDAVRLKPEKSAPFPGRDLRYAAEREALLVLFRDWGKNARIREFLDLEFMSEIVHHAARPDAPEDLAGYDLTPAIQVGLLLSGDGAVP